jgi:membrane associated rhomboid family serine protease
MTKTVKQLIIANIVVFILMHLFSNWPWGILAMTPKLVFSKFMIWQPITYMFLHAGLMHLFFNMLVLAFFGPAVEEIFGRKNFIFYYFFTGVGAALCSFIFSFNSSIIGASGATFGILLAYAMIYPDSTVILFIFPVKARLAVLILGLFNLGGAISSSGDGIAYFAHLGGALFGYLYMKSEWLKLHLLRFKPKEAKSFRPKTKKPKLKPHQKNIDKMVDEILDKISKQGLKSLTKAEQRILEEKSRK